MAAFTMWLNVIPQWIIEAQSDDNNERKFSNLHSCLCLAAVLIPEPWHSPKPCSKGSLPALDVSLQSLKQQHKQHGQTLAGTIWFPPPNPPPICAQPPGAGPPTWTRCCFVLLEKVGLFLSTVALCCIFRVRFRVSNPLCMAKLW